MNTNGDAIKSITIIRKEFHTYFTINPFVLQKRKSTDDLEVLKRKEE